MRAQPQGTAERNGRLWGTRAADWPEQEAHEGARYDEAIGRLGIDSFDLVAGFNAFFVAADMTAALGEARRVARPGAAVLVQVWGRPDRWDLTPALRAIRALRPAPGLENEWHYLIATA